MKHTPGPWRWEFNAQHKTVDLVGGRPMFDLPVMDFARWGMSRAVPRFRDTSEDGMNLMDRLCDKPEWIEPEPGREHHKHWHQLVTHPDANLIASAPNLLQALKQMLDAFYHDPLGGGQDAAIEAALDAVAKVEGEK